jgi:GNAT superfamily N-acetyltransferase
LQGEKNVPGTFFSPAQGSPVPPGGGYRPSVRVQPIAQHQYRELADLTVAAYRALLDTPLSPGYEAVLRDVAARDRDAAVLVAIDDDGTLLGGVTYVPEPDNPYAEFDGGDQAGFRMLAVRPHLQGRGAGTALVEACIDRARRDGKRELTLYTTNGMVAAHRLYERFGFRRAPEFDMMVEDQLQLLSYVLTL